MNRSSHALRLLGIFSLAAAGLAQDKPSDTGAGSPGAKPESVLFEALPVVEAASLHAQTLLEAPASVTIITDEDIRRRGYRTLADVLADVRGMYVSYDRAYHAVGVRGFSLPGDYNTRLLVMINDHSLTENIYGSADYFGQDFGLDMELIKRIEIIRGPSSALYGTNGMFATINIVTKSPVEYEPLRVTTDLGSFGERKVHVSTSLYLGRGANLLLGASVFNNAGQDLYFPEFNSPQTNHGWATGVDGEKGYHSFANLIWRGWSFLAYFNGREKLVPTAWYASTFNGRGNKVLDGRGFVESAYQRKIGAEGSLKWRIYYDRYRFLGRYDDATDSGPVDERDQAKGDWAGTQLTYRFRLPRLGFLTVGSEASWDLRAEQLYYQVSPVYENLMHIDRRDRLFGAFFQQEWQFSRRWTLYLGGRLDDSRFHSVSLTPRVALVYQPSTATVLKLLYGRSFRNPNSFEEFYDDSGASQVPNPGLRPERMTTFEADFERRIAKRLNLVANVYNYRLKDLIGAVPVSGAVQQFQNVTGANATGFGVEATGQLASRVKVDASFSFQHPNEDTSALLRVNSPAQLGKLMVERPLLGDRISVSGGFQYMSERTTLAGHSLPPVYLVNLTAASRRLGNGLELQFGLRNLFNYRYWDPAGVQQEMDRIQQDGRSFFVRLSWSAQPAAGDTAGPAGQPKTGNTP